MKLENSANAESEREAELIANLRSVAEPDEEHRRYYSPALRALAFEAMVTIENLRADLERHFESSGHRAEPAAKEGRTEKGGGHRHSYDDKGVCKVAGCGALSRAAKKWNAVKVPEAGGGSST